MSSRSALLGVLLLTTVLLAGCAGGSAKSAEPAPLPSSEIQGSGSPIEGTGSIRGVIVDEQTLPLEGVSIAVRSITVDATLQATTDAAGGFLISNIAAGSYHVFAAKLGYQSATKAITVVDADETRFTLALAQVAVEEIFHDTIGPYKGFVTCAYTRPGVSGVTSSVTYNCPGAAGDVFGEAINEFQFELLQPNVLAIQGELRWSPTAVGTSQRLSLFLTPEGGTGGNWYCMTGGQSPVTMVWTPEEEKDQCDRRGSDPDPEVPDMDTPLVFTVYLPFDSINPSAPDKSSPPNVVFQQDYESIATIFYGKEPEPGFTAFADA